MMIAIDPQLNAQLDHWVAKLRAAKTMKELLHASDMIAHILNLITFTESS